MEKRGPLIKLLLQTGVVQTPAAAKNVLYIIVVICVVILVWSFTRGSGASYGNYDEMLERHPELAE